MILCEKCFSCKMSVKNNNPPPYEVEVVRSQNLTVFPNISFPTEHTLIKCFIFMCWIYSVRMCVSDSRSKSSDGLFVFLGLFVFYGFFYLVYRHNFEH